MDPLEWQLIIVNLTLSLYFMLSLLAIWKKTYKFSGSKYFSELDLCKASYQVPLTDRARPLTAFPTHLGLMEFLRMPFGLVTACATYIRLMRIVLADLPDVIFLF